MALRVGVDIDGVLADFRTAFESAAKRVGVEFGPEQADTSASDPLSSREIKRIWEHVKKTPNWWVHLSPFEPEQIARLYELARRLKWEVVFLTRRPSTAGDPVQFQTQWWLEQQGYYYPAVLTVPGSRGELANAVRLDIVIDDQLLNCIDVVSGSTAKALLLLRDGADKATKDHAVSRGIGVVSTFEEAVDVMENLHESLRERNAWLQRLCLIGSPGGKAPAESSLPTRPDTGRVTLRNG